MDNTSDNSTAYIASVSNWKMSLDKYGNLNIVGNNYRNGSLLSISGVTFSDERIKTNINDINDDTALKQILKIQPKTYNYIDQAERGSNLVIGFIAQQVKEVIPEAVSLESQFIPNIYKTYDVINSNTICINDSNIDKINVGDILKINDGITKNINANVISKTSNEITVDAKLENTDCLVYGTKINDFHMIDKTYIFTLNVCATQELYKLIQQQQIIINDLQNRLSILENKNI